MYVLYNTYICMYNIQYDVLCRRMCLFLYTRTTLLLPRSVSSCMHNIPDGRICRTKLDSAPSTKLAQESIATHATNNRGSPHRGAKLPRPPLSPSPFLLCCLPKLVFAPIFSRDCLPCPQQRQLVSFRAFKLIIKSQSTYARLVGCWLVARILSSL